jgi:high-affinity iron transporter
MSRFSSKLLFSFLVLFSVSNFAQDSPPAIQNHKALKIQEDQLPYLRQLSQLVEYIGVDYAAAINKGEIENADEYQEMLEFSALIVTKTSTLEILSNHTLLKQAQALQEAVKQKAFLVDVRQLATTLRRSLLTLMPDIVLPQNLLSLKATQVLFQENCASCHGVSGQGDGALAKQLSPEPTNFTDKERAINRSLLGLFDAITNGLDDTAMPAFTQLKEQQRWSLAFYVGSLAFQNNNNSENKAKIDDLPNIMDWVLHSPSQIKQSSKQLTPQQVELLRAQPLTLFIQQQSPIVVAKSQLQQALTSYKNKDYSQASTLAVSAYLDGFELVENSLDARDSDLRKNIEVDLIALRQFIAQEDNEAQLFELADKIFIQLNQAEQLLSGESLSNTALFSASLVILLREGLEALLVIIALMTVLVRTQRKDALKFIHIGWIAALVAGVATWAAAQSLINISGASREVMEGGAAMIAAIMLLYVGIWMHSKTNAKQWQTYIQKHINTQLQAGTLWGLAGLSFIAVYREVFETVLFYQSLLTQASPAQFSVVLSGFILGGVLLAVVAWLLLKYSVKLPIAKFFSTTTYLLLALAFILMGKAVSALQEAAIFTISPLPINIEMSWLGIGSTWQGLMAQMAVIMFFVVYFYLNKSKHNSEQLQLTE